jgi:PAS domain S-box-containing protein
MCARRKPENGKPAAHAQMPLASLLERVSDGIVVLDRQWRYLYVNAAGAGMFGRRAEDLIGKHIWTEFPDGVGQPFHLAYERAMESQHPIVIEERYEPWDRWFENRIYPSPSGVTIFYHETTERNLQRLLLESQIVVLEAIADGLPIDTVLSDLALNMEKVVRGSLASVVLLDEDGVHARHGAAPGLPMEFRAAIDGQLIGPSAGSCGTAMYLGEPVVVEDIRVDPLWRDYREVADRHGLRSCWSIPIKDAHDRVLGSFALYWREPRKPTPFHMHAVHSAAHLAAIALASDRQRSELRESYERIRMLAAAAERVREAERTRIARELHDELGQLLTGLKMDLASLARREAVDTGLRAGLQAMSRMVDDAVGVGRRIASELRPGILDDLGLIAALGWLARDSAKRAGIQVDTDLPEEIAIDSERATAAFRIVQEALTNVTRHARASRVWVRATVDDGMLQLEVRDDGRGLVRSAPASHSFGVLGMRERAATWGGSVDLVSHLGEGTTVIARIPLEGAT